MNDEILENQNNTFQNTTALEICEIKNIKRISFWATLIYKIKNRNLKLLPSRTSIPKTTYKSISYMWILNNFKISLFNKFDNIKSSILKPKSTEIINSLINKDENIKNIESSMTNNENIENNSSIIITNIENSNSLINDTEGMKEEDSSIIIPKPIKL